MPGWGCVRLAEQDRRLALDSAPGRREGHWVTHAAVVSKAEEARTCVSNSNVVAAERLVPDMPHRGADSPRAPAENQGPVRVHLDGVLATTLQGAAQVENGHSAATSLEIWPPRRSDCPAGDPRGTAAAFGEQGAARGCAWDASTSKSALLVNQALQAHGANSRLRERNVCDAAAMR